MGSVFESAPIVATVSLALPAPPFPLCHYLFSPSLLLLQKLGAVRLPCNLPLFLQREVGLRGSQGASPALAPANSHGIGLSSPLTGFGHGRGAGGQGGVAGFVRRLSKDRGNSGSRAGSASAVTGSSRPGPKPSLRDLARLFLSLSGSLEQWDAVAGSAFLAVAKNAGSLPGSAALEPVSAPSACSSARVPAPGAGSPAGGASAAGLLGRSWESPRLERRRRHSSIRVRDFVGVGLLPLPALLIWLAHPPPLHRVRANGRV